MYGTMAHVVRVSVDCTALSVCSLLAAGFSEGDRATREEREEREAYRRGPQDCELQYCPSPFPCACYIECDACCS